MKNKGVNRVGKTNTNTQGSVMEVTEYNYTTDITVRFLEHGNFVKTTWQQFSDGEVKNPYDRTIFSVGYLGEGDYQAYFRRKATPQYASWKHMIERCYDVKIHKKHPTYIGCTVVDEWHNFQNFAKWYDEHYYEVENQRMNLDKDILIKGNKIYSPETCIFVPSRINSLFTKKNANRGNTPVGVTYSNRDKVYIAKCMLGNGKDRKIIGSFKTAEEAFDNYKIFKETLIKQIANEFKDKIPNILYKAMFNYRVDIDD